MVSTLAALSATDAPARMRLRVLMRGTVQGVGFRPFVYRKATEFGLAGWVANSIEGVTLEAEGDSRRLAEFVTALRSAAPPASAVLSVEIHEIPPRGDATFRIRRSQTLGARAVQAPPDLATCADCLAELFDASNRRHLYPFINCTQCGPRYSIIEDLPYDRERTSMRHFPLCQACRAEYEAPGDRRFHAEPNSCPDCGPRLALWDSGGKVIAGDHEALLMTAAALRAGKIVAAKSVGGFHLLVDARDDNALQRLRARKRREEKPFAVMFPDLSNVKANCSVSSEEEALLTAPARPIVLLRRSGASIVSVAAAPGSPWTGALPPYAPVHHLLMRELGFPLVATSGNVSGEPIVTDERQALGRLSGIADLFLVHDRPIVRPVDDSVARVVCGRELMLRRARGYAPARFACEGASEGVLALGGHLKTTVALTQANAITLGPHIGDMETIDARDSHARAAADMSRLCDVRPRIVACDLHPDYATSRVAETFSLPILRAQHHLAHVAACLAEHSLSPPALGVAWDGAGYGPDGAVWGGEFLLVTKSGWRRVAHLREFRLPGGDAAAREPRRAALGLLYEAFGEKALTMTHLPPIADFSLGERAVLGAMLARALNAPRTSSMGRLFDAFAAICGLRQRATYEGQAAAEFEWAADGYTTGPGYEFRLSEGAAANGALVLDWRPALEAALADLSADARAGAASAAFHAGLAKAIVAVAERIGERRVVLSGGCFQNARLTESAVAALCAAGFEPTWHRRIPPNDGGLALGQAAWAVWSLAGDQSPCA